ncbi:MAG TPA: hypothetical protein VMU88_06790, partial [bacterium]|nr:hypothetical protein [bacterium]
LAEAALKWTLAFPEVSTSITGIRNPLQARVNAAAGEGKPLAAPLARKARDLYRKNFGLPVVRVASLDAVPAVFISGARLAPKGKAKAKKARPQPAAKNKKRKKK